jgi:hypothetical protein
VGRSAFDAISETGGTLTGSPLTFEASLVDGSRDRAMEEAAEVIAEAQADEAVAHEAVTALTAAGLIVAAAGQAAADALAENGAFLF